MRILIVEDHLEVLDCLRMYFTEKGHEVATASTAPEAMACLNRLNPDLAIVDMLLPKGHGREVLREIASRAARARNDGREVKPTRMVVVTGSDDLELKKEAQSLGVSDYLFKPVTVLDLDTLFGASEGKAVVES